MDPFTIALIASAVLAAGQGIYGAAHRSPAEKFNKERLKQMESGMFGMSADEQRLLYQRLLQPARTAADQQRQQYERIAAATGAQSPELVQLRKEYGQRLGDAVQGASLGVTQADLQQRQSDRTEYQQRLNAKSAYQADRVNALFGAGQQTASALGQAFGAPKEVWQNLEPSTAQYLQWLWHNDRTKYYELMPFLAQPAAPAGMTTAQGAR